MRKLEIKIAGTTHPNPDGGHRMTLLCRLYDHVWTEGLGDEIVLELRPEPDNEHDPSAVGVWCVEPEIADPGVMTKLGFVPGDRTEVVNMAIDRGLLRSVRFKKMETGSGGAVWCILLLEIGKPPVAQR